MANKSLVPLMVAALLCSVLPARSQSGLPDGHGKEAVQAFCTQCHEINRVTGAGYTQEGWQNV